MIEIILVVTGIMFVGMTGTVVYDSVLQSKKKYKLEMIDELMKRGFKEKEIERRETQSK